MTNFFGTDGIRGRAGTDLTPELVLRATYGLSRELKARGSYQPKQRPSVVIGQDSRLSSPLLATAAASGLMLGGFDVQRLGIVPTPVVAQAILRQNAAGGVMVTASHNPVPDNGIKFFGPDGMKLSADMERAISATIQAPGRLMVSDRQYFGTESNDDPAAAYLRFVKSAVRSRGNGKPMKVVLDCAYGATGRLAPLAFEQAGFDIVAINTAANGNRINVKCGATDLGPISRRVKREGANLGLAFDGDGDRVKAVDENGVEVNGDKLIALFALNVKRYREQGAVIMTHMTNMGVEQALKRNKIAMIRTDVGDIKVLAEMLKRKLDLGGEQSGHIILRNHLPGGDGILAGLLLATILRRKGRPLSELAAPFEEYPQILTNLQVKDNSGWKSDKRFLSKLDRVRASYAEARAYLRPSGTEKGLIRVLTEARDPVLCKASNEAICAEFLSWDQQH
jgi:phosphoglucosamine mutase